MSAEHLDVLIIGAGLSGIGAAYHLMKHCRGTRRHLGPVPLSGHPFRLGHVHPRLQLQTLDQPAGDC